MQAHVPEREQSPPAPAIGNAPDRQVPMPNDGLREGVHLYLRPRTPLRVGKLPVRHHTRDGRPVLPRVARRGWCHHQPRETAHRWTFKFIVRFPTSHDSVVGDRAHMEWVGVRVLPMPQDVQIARRAQRPPRKSRARRQAVPLPHAVRRVRDRVPDAERHPSAHRGPGAALCGAAFRS